MDRAVFRAHCDFKKYIFIYLKFLKFFKAWTEHHLENNEKCTKIMLFLCVIFVLIF